MASYQTNTDTTPFLSFLRQAAYLNRKGVAALSHPDPRGVPVALTALRESLRILQQVSPHARGQPPAPPMVFPTMGSSGRVPMPQDGAFYVYDHAKLFSPPTDEALARAQLPVLSAMVVFNTALAYHRYGMVSKSTKYFEAALRLYPSCAQLCIMHGGTNEDMLVLYMAVANNMVLIQNELVRLQDLQSTVTTLKRVMNLVSSRNQTMSIPNMDAVNEFQLNLMTVNALAPASAA